MTLDVDFVRHQFTQATDENDVVFCSNAGGSYVANRVSDLFDHFNRHTRVQPYSPFSPSREAGEAMDRARSLWSSALNVDPGELTFGPSTSINTYVMSQAIGATLGAGDEIVVCQQDHEANHGVWRRVAEQCGAAVREWHIDPDTGLLDTEDLYSLLTDRTRWVFFPHCSNLVGTINPVSEIVEGIRARSAARVGVDGVAYAPHHLPDLMNLDVDLYVFSLYKVYGPHQGVLYVKADVGDELRAQSHWFLVDDPAKRFNPAGPQHAEVAASAGIIDYFEDLAGHHKLAGEGGLRERLELIHEMMAAHEAALATPILDQLHQSADVRLLGKAHCGDMDRAATIAFRPLRQSAADVAQKLRARGIGTESGHFYAQRVLEGMGIDTADGVVRISLVHYNTASEVRKIQSALDEALG
jgi:cysteine desulfurase family protein (TIGR01976 family)